MVYDIISSAGRHTEREDIRRKNQNENSMIRWQYCQMSETWIVYLQYEESLKKNPIAYNIAMLKKYIGRL